MAESENILQRIAAKTRERVAEEKAQTPQSVVEAQAREVNSRKVAAGETGDAAFPFERALKAPGMSFICELKQASPSKGIIAQDYPYLDIARDYEKAGAAAISCLTEPTWFKGSDEHLRQVAAAVDIPVLRKDFIVDEYMIYQARACGASAVLLICSILSDLQLADYTALAHELGMSALVEAYQPDEVPRAIAAGARVVGVNNRDLRTFDVDFDHSIKLRPTVGLDRVFVSESGVRTRADVEELEAAGVDAVLIGETLMRSPDKTAALAELRGGPANNPVAVEK
ncbi:indole-3-glycerol phosphate synthase TrpC [Bifidobacterium sp. ESL0784]|uniref:indole-3-glycerol phosphate synthase TrpC n=1 Tax=Bifidobacterium sp. ESL0784 TaxID=2983231 RepID=UPI0023F8A1AC|nr:indole-3-glycerol phosphate synthase TrpC [Bifidobacterium sp. ESL0784]MDF7640246.1 indole-3-glycerol phosphate synthase TrpC [Bifidobacterium sp. ESL0784]